MAVDINQLVAAAKSRQLQGQTAGQQKKIKAMGGKPKKGGPSVLSRVFDVISRPMYGVMEPVARAAEGKDALDIARGVGAGLAGKKKTSGFEVLERGAEHSAALRGINANPIARGVAGFGLSIVGDPLTYVGGGIVKAGGEAAAKTAGLKAVAEHMAKPEVGTKLRSLANKTLQDAGKAREAEILEGTAKPFTKREAQKLQKAAVHAASLEEGKPVFRQAYEAAKTEAPGKVQLKVFGKPVAESEKLYSTVAKGSQKFKETKLGKSLSEKFQTTAKLPEETRNISRRVRQAGIKGAEERTMRMRTMLKEFGLTDEEAISISHAIEAGDQNLDPAARDIILGRNKETRQAAINLKSPKAAKARTFASAKAISDPEAAVAAIREARQHLGRQVENLDEVISRQGYNDLQNLEKSTPKHIWDEAVKRDKQEYLTKRGRAPEQLGNLGDEFADLEPFGAGDIVPGSGKKTEKTFKQLTEEKSVLKPQKKGGKAKPTPATIAEAVSTPTPSKVREELEAQRIVGLISDEDYAAHVARLDELEGKITTGPSDSANVAKSELKNIQQQIKQAKEPTAEVARTAEDASTLNELLIGSRADITKMPNVAEEASPFATKAQIDAEIKRQKLENTPGNRSMIEEQLHKGIEPTHMLQGDRPVHVIYRGEGRAQIIDPATGRQHNIRDADLTPIEKASEYAVKRSKAQGGNTIWTVHKDGKWVSSHATKAEAEAAIPGAAPALTPEQEAYRVAKEQEAAFERGELDYSKGKLTHKETGEDLGGIHPRPARERAEAALVASPERTEKYKEVERLDKEFWDAEPERRNLESQNARHNKAIEMEKARKSEVKVTHSTDPVIQKVTPASIVTRDIKPTQLRVGDRIKTQQGWQYIEGVHVKGGKTEITVGSGAKVSLENDLNLANAVSRQGDNVVVPDVPSYTVQHNHYVRNIKSGDRVYGKDGWKLVDEVTTNDVGSTIRFVDGEELGPWPPDSTLSFSRPLDRPKSRVELSFHPPGSTQGSPGSWWVDYIEDGDKYVVHGPHWSDGSWPIASDPVYRAMALEEAYKHTGFEGYRVAAREAEEEAIKAAKAESSTVKKKLAEVEKKQKEAAARKTKLEKELEKEKAAKIKAADEAIAKTAPKEAPKAPVAEEGRQPLHTVKAGDRVWNGEEWRTVKDVEISYTAKGADEVTVKFEDGGTWSKYDANQGVKVEKATGREVEDIVSDLLTPKAAEEVAPKYTYTKPAEHNVRGGKGLKPGDKVKQFEGESYRTVEKVDNLKGGGKRLTFEDGSTMTIYPSHKRGVSIIRAEVGKAVATPPVPKNPLEDLVSAVKGRELGPGSSGSWLFDNNIEGIGKGRPGIGSEVRRFTDDELAEAVEQGYNNADHMRSFVHRDASGNPNSVLNVVVDDTGKPLFFHVATHPNVQRQGLATKLFAAAKKEFPDLESVSGKQGITDQGKAFATSRQPMQGPPIPHGESPKQLMPGPQPKPAPLEGPVHGPGIPELGPEYGPPLKPPVDPGDATIPSLMHLLEGEQKYRSILHGVKSQSGRDLGEAVDLVRELFRELGQIEVDAGLFKPAKDSRGNIVVSAQDMLKDDYVYHSYRGGDEKVRHAFKQNRRKILGTDIPTFTRERSVVSLKAAKEKGLDPVEDIRDILALRIGKHHEAMARRAFLNDTTAMYGVKMATKAERQVAKEEGMITMDDAMKQLAREMGIKPPKGVPGFEHVYYPEKIARSLGAIEMAHQTPEFASDFMRIFDKIQGHWKFTATGLNPGHHIRNMVGDAWNSYIGGVSDPRHWGTSGMILRDAKHNPEKFLKKAQYKIGNMTLTGKELMDEWIRAGAAPGFWSAEFGKDIALDPLIIKRKIIEMGEKREEFMRFGYFIGALKQEAKGVKTLSALEKAGDIAGNRTRKWLIDYGDLTDFESSVMKRAMPFYTWSRKNIPLQIEALALNPGKISKIPKANAAIEAMLGTDTGYNEMGPGVLPKWLKEMAPIRLSNEDGTGHSLMGVPALPFQDISKFTEGGKQGILRSLVSQVTPFAKIPVEQATGQQLFSGAPTGSDAQYFSQQVPLARMIASMARTGEGIAGRDIDMTKLINYITGAGVYDVGPKQTASELRRQQDISQGQIHQLRERMRK